MVNIAPTRPETAIRSPGLVEKIICYNRTLESTYVGKSTRFFDSHFALLEGGVDKMILEDGIHLSLSGNMAITQMFNEEINNTIVCLNREGRIG